MIRTFFHELLRSLKALGKSLDAIFSHPQNVDLTRPKPVELVQVRLRDYILTPTELEDLGIFPFVDPPELSPKGGKGSTQQVKPYDKAFHGFMRDHLDTLLTKAKEEFFSEPLPDPSFGHCEMILPYGPRPPVPDDSQLAHPYVLAKLARFRQGQPVEKQQTDFSVTPHLMPYYPWPSHSLWFVELKLVKQGEGHEALEETMESAMQRMVPRRRIRGYDRQLKRVKLKQTRYQSPSRFHESLLHPARSLLP